MAAYDSIFLAESMKISELSASEIGKTSAVDGIIISGSSSFVITQIIRPKPKNHKTRTSKAERSHTIGPEFS